MANTVIQLKWSESTNTPSSLNVAEPAYSNSSNKLFIGLADNSVISIGGKYYTDIVDAATNNNTASTLVKRNASGNFSAGTITAALSGNATTASAWQTARNLGVSGDATGIVSVDGSAAANIPLTLASSGVTAATYGGATQIPTFAVDAKGRITSAANVALSTTFNFAGNTGTGTTSTGGTITVAGQNGGGITTTFTDATDTFGLTVDSTVVRTSGAQSIAGDLSVTGNLIVAGTQTFVNTSTVVTTDSLLKLGANNTVGDVIDIGFYGTSNTGSSVQYHGLVRQGSGGANAGAFYLFKNLGTDPTGNVVSYGSLTKADLHANLTGGTVTGLSSDIVVSDGGTGAGTFTAGQLLVGNGTNPLQSLANTGTAGTYGAQTHVPVLTTDGYGRVSGVSNTAIGGLDTSVLSSGILGVARGGTNNISYTTGAILQYNGSGIVSLANTGTAGTFGAQDYVPVITTDAYGRVSGVNNTAIGALNTSVLTAGTLGVARGGTGAASFSTNGVILSGASSTTALSALTSSTQGHVLQINASGVPIFAHLNGGSF